MTTTIAISGRTSPAAVRGRSAGARSAPRRAVPAARSGTGPAPAGSSSSPRPGTRSRARPAPTAAKHHRADCSPATLPRRWPARCGVRRTECARRRIRCGTRQAAVSSAQLGCRKSSATSIADTTRNSRRLAAQANPVAAAPGELGVVRRRCSCHPDSIRTPGNEPNPLAHAAVVAVVGRLTSSATPAESRALRAT